MKITESFAPLLDFGHPVQQTVMSIYAVFKGGLRPLGTGFAISADGLLMTAHHVIDEAFRLKSELQNAAKNNPDAEFSVYALYVTNEDVEGEGKKRGGFIPIMRYWSTKDLDIGFCWLNLPTRDGVRLKLPLARLSPGLPKVGEKILGFGYHHMTAQLNTDQSGHHEIKIDQKPSFTRGEVVDIFPVRRDSVRLPFPCFQTNARFEGGMSGGPILNQSGFVCGIICSSYHESEEQVDYISYGSLIWPSLGSSIEVAVGTSKNVGRVSLFDLVQAGYVATDDSIQSLNVTQEPDGRKLVSLRVP